MKRIPAAEASRVAERTAPAGTKKTAELIAGNAETASEQELKTGIPSTSWPPLPGVTPARTFVPKPVITLVVLCPCLPVIPKTTTQGSPIPARCSRIPGIIPPPVFRVR